MKKLIAIINVIAWSGFWAFGYLALTAEGLSQTQITIAAMLAFGGMLSGIWAYMRLVRASESSGYARASGVLDPQARRAAQEQWEA